MDFIEILIGNMVVAMAEDDVINERYNVIILFMILNLYLYDENYINFKCIIFIFTILE